MAPIFGGVRLGQMSECQYLAALENRANGPFEAELYSPPPYPSVFPSRVPNHGPKDVAPPVLFIAASPPSPAKLVAANLPVCLLHVLSQMRETDTDGSFLLVV